MNRKYLFTGLLILVLLTGWSQLRAQDDTIFLPIIQSGSESSTLPTDTATPTVTATATEAGTSPTVTPTVAATSTPTSIDDTTPTIVAAANAFLATLSSSEQASVLFDWDDTAQKQRWSNLPEGGFTRDGLMWGDLSQAQQNAWLVVMQATLSTEGYNRVLAEWYADDELGGGGGGGLQYGSDYYWIALIGTPSTMDPWQWQFGGHHMTVNATISGSRIALTPSFIGVQPATYTDDDGNTVRPLGDVEDTAFILVNALDSTQQATAILGNTAIDLVLGPGEDGRTIASEGLPGSQMTTDQRSTFLQLIGYYAGLANNEDAAALMTAVEATLDDTYFAWYGSTTQGQAAYFRVTGPEVIIEYATQSMGGNPANHIHGVYRHPTNDYGADITS